MLEEIAREIESAHLTRPCRGRGTGIFRAQPEGWRRAVPRTVRASDVAFGEPEWMRALLRAPPTSSMTMGPVDLMTTSLNRG